MFSRIGTGYRAILYPFRSYVDVFSGSWRSFEEIIDNIFLFIPFGMIICAIKEWRWKRVIFAGLYISVGIELLQAIFALGTFEFDDLMHNAARTAIGHWIIKKIGLRTEIKRLQLRVLLLALFIAIVSPIAMQTARHSHMVKLANRYDREDGSNNLLVLNGKSGFAWDTDMYIESLPDGSISIKGTSDKKSWFPIGQIELEPGTYSFSGLT